MSPRARQAKSRARVSAYEELLAEHRRATDSQHRAGALQITIPMSRRLGSQVIEADGLVKAYGDTLLFDDLSFRLPAGGIVGVDRCERRRQDDAVPLLAGDEQPDAGTITIGETVDIAYVDQSRAVLDDGRTVYEEITSGHDTLRITGLDGAREINGRAFVASFNFTGSDQQKRVGDLAGGERNRVHLARTLTSGCNVLLLDEPTNDLDVDTLRSLEAALESFGGCAVVISHDRWFLDRIATHVLAFEGNSAVRWFEGNFTEYEPSASARWALMQTRLASRTGRSQAELAVSVRPVRIATWNVNSLNARLERVDEWLDHAEPDVLLLQETKMADEPFPHLHFEAQGYDLGASRRGGAGTGWPSCRAWASTTRSLDSPTAASPTPMRESSQRAAEASP